ncbi:MAG: anhydro-N-acetylmuramic acid kinase, partial [Planctomycetota bacterium]
AGIEAGQVLAIGLHGQTIRHRPGLRHPFSLQIGSAAVLAERTGRTVVSGFRERDIAAGGQGAPLVPFAHRRFLADSGADVAVVNIGGMANITFLGADGTTLGFDTGPGNALMDALMVALTDGRAGMDENGELAAAGSACDELLDRLMAHPFFRRRPPKSTGREDFGYEQLDLLLGWPGLSDADRMATALELTARTIADAGRFLPRAPARWLICGGGSRNRTLMQRLATLLAPAPVAPTDRYGLPAAAIEAASFAVLAWEALRGRPNTLASVTGAARDVVGGMISPGANWPEIVRLIGSWTR